MKKYKLGEVATIEVSGVDKKTKKGETPISLCNFTDVYYNWAITKGMYQGFMRATANTNEISRFSLREGQVALTKDSETRFDIGISSYIAEDFSDVILGYHCALITPDESKLDGRYLNAFLHSDMSRKYFANNASGSGQRYALTAQSVTDLPIWLPSLITQKRIGQLFSAIDRKIALNRSINHNLEAMAKQLYDYWFVQFDFPDENGRPYKSSGGKMVWDEKLKRNIPEDWSAKHLNQIENNIITGKTPSTSIKGNFQGDIPFITIDDIRQELFIFNTSRTLTAKGANSQVRKTLPKGSLCCSCIGTPGILGFVGIAGQTNQQINSIIFHNVHNREFLYFSLDLYFQFASAKIGNILPNMSKMEFSKILLPYPSNRLVERYHTIVNPIFQKIRTNTKELLELTKLRDELLPLLMNGQVSVNYDLSHD